MNLFGWPNIHCGVMAGVRELDRARVSPQGYVTGRGATWAGLGVASMSMACLSALTRGAHRRCTEGHMRVTGTRNGDWG
jgi:hypothetical protein